MFEELDELPSKKGGEEKEEGGKVERAKALLDQAKDLLVEAGEDAEAYIADYCGGEDEEEESEEESSMEPEKKALAVAAMRKRAALTSGRFGSEVSPVTVTMPFRER